LQTKEDIKREKENFMIVDSSYHYHGFWYKDMVKISKDGELSTIGSDKDEIECIGYIADTCSSRDAIHIDLYAVKVEDNLCYLDEEVENGKNGIIIKHIKLTFNKKSEKLKDKVIDKLLKEATSDLIVKIDEVNVCDTFFCDLETAMGVISENIEYQFENDKKDEPIHSFDKPTFLPKINNALKQPDVEVSADDIPF